jgi:hypothetical protein
MSPRSENRNEMTRPRDGRRRELRELLVTAAKAARATRQTVMDRALSRTTPRAVRERMTVFFAAIR